MLTLMSRSLLTPTHFPSRFRMPLFPRKRALHCPSFHTASPSMRLPLMRSFVLFRLRSLQSPRFMAILPLMIFVCTVWRASSLRAISTNVSTRHARKPNQALQRTGYPHGLSDHHLLAPLDTSPAIGAGR